MMDILQENFASSVAIEHTIQEPVGVIWTNRDGEEISEAGTMAWYSYTSPLR